MNKQYGDLYALFRHDPSAEAYFNELPSFVQEHIRANHHQVDSFGRLMDYASAAQTFY